MKRLISFALAAFLMLAFAGAEKDEAVKVAYLGPEGTYTEEATRLWFGEGEELLPMKTVDDAIALLLDGEADYAVIPQENTLGGAVLNYIDALVSSENVYVTGEVILPISQMLMGLPGATLGDITLVCSHAQGLTQSRQWRETHLPLAETLEMTSTAAAASYVAEQGDKTIAAIAAPGAAQLYGLQVLATDVQITNANKTRFYVLSTKPLEGEDLTGAVFVVTCEANRIDDIIVEMHDAGLEMVCLHDRPQGSMLGKYHYIIEVENPAGITDEQISAVTAFEGVRFAGRFCTVKK